MNGKLQRLDGPVRRSLGILAETPALETLWSPNIDHQGLARRRGEEQRINVLSPGSSRWSRWSDLNRRPAHYE